MEVRGLSFSYGEKEILKDFSLSLPAGKRVCVMGESGRGKTTLMRLLSGLEKPMKGSITYAPDERPSVVFQEDRLLPWFSALRNVEEVYCPDRCLVSPRELLCDMELEDSLDKLPKELSGGMQRRVAIARALAFGGSPLLLDEPFKGLDPEMRERIAAKVLERSDGAAILLISHDPHEAELLKCDEMIRL